METTMVPAVLLTPLLLAAEPAWIKPPEITYDHGTQTSTFNGVDAVKVKFTWTHTFQIKGPGDSDGDEDGRR
jgi:hypothetical protein